MLYKKNENFLEKLKNQLIYVIIPLAITNYYWHLITYKYIGDPTKPTESDTFINTLIKTSTILAPLSGIVRYAMSILIPTAFGFPIHIIMSNIEGILSYCSNFFFTIIYVNLIDKISINFFYVILYFISAICIFIIITLYSYFNGLLNKGFLIVLAVIVFRYYVESLVKHHIMEIEKINNIYIDALIYSLASSFGYLVAFIMTYWI